MNYNDVRKNENKGFSLVELIVVIAIMAVLTAVLAPSLLTYVERSRAQKDDSAMGEVSNAMMLALADQNVYDEVLRYTCLDNVSCYIHEGGDIEDNKITTKVANATAGTAEQFLYTDASRVTDEEKFEAAGVMRGVTITFSAEHGANSTIFKLADGAINDLASSLTYINGEEPANMTLGTMSSVDGGANHFLFNRVASIVGQQIKLTSQTYRNSDYTVFIRMGTTGGNDFSNQDAIAVYGQWNGTNLPVAEATSPAPTACDECGQTTGHADGCSKA